MDPNIQHDLLLLRRQYFQLVDIHQLRWPTDDILKRSSVQSWLYHSLFDSDSLPTLPPERYQLRVLKLLTSKLERIIGDPEEDVCFPFSSFFLHYCVLCFPWFHY